MDVSITGEAMRRVIFNQKGGVGKSSIAANLAAISAYKGRQTLVVDLDTQCNASQYLLGKGLNSMDRTVADFFKQFLGFHLGGAVNPAEFVVATRYDNLFIMPASPELADLQGKLETKHKIYKLRETLIMLDEVFTDIYIDTPPAFNFFTLSALIAAQTCLIPFDCDDFSRRALYSLLENVEEVRSDHNSTLKVEGIVVNQFMAQASLPTRLVAELQAEGLPVLNTKLPASIKMRESHEHSSPLIHLAPKHKLTEQYLALYDELAAA